MIHIIPLIIGYIGGDVSTSLARDHVDQIVKHGIYNPDCPVSLIVDREDVYKDGKTCSGFLLGGYTTTEILEKMSPHLSWFNVLHHASVPLEFVLKNKDKCPGSFFMNPKLPLDILREEAKREGTKFWDRILYNSALFSEGVEAAEDVINSITAMVWGASVNLSMNMGAPLEFFVRNPQYINWGGLTKNPGEIYSKATSSEAEEKKVISFLNSGMKDWDYLDWKNVSSNRRIPLQFLKDNISKLDLFVLSCNPSIPFSWWEENMKASDIEANIGRLVRLPLTPFSAALKYGGVYQKEMILRSYNAPVDKILELCKEDNDWIPVIQNQGFWIHLAERELKPILESFFYGDSP